MTVRIHLLLFLLLLASGCSSPSGVYHTVQEGQTLYRIGRVYGVDERHLARINRIDDPSVMRVGTRLYIPGADRLRVVPVATAPPAAAPNAAPPSSPPQPPTGLSRPSVSSAPASRPQSPAVSKPGAPTVRKPGAPTAKPAGKPATASAGKFIWPVRGQVLKKFGGDGATPIKGLEIAAARGTPIQSAAAGRVIYSGDGIRSYGNLVILKHDDDFFTVYGFNEKNIVEVGTFVSKGERIALSGTPPSGGKPRLYFEIRRGKEPLDPIFFLP